jgi:hypothetical protein
VGKTKRKSPEVGEINHSQMGGLLLFYPDYIIM